MGKLKWLPLLLMMTGSAWAEDAEVCRPYARLATDSIIREVWNRAYNHCMNLEEGGNPTPPDTWAAMEEMLSPKLPMPVSRPVHKSEPPPGSVPASGPPADEVIADKPVAAPEPAAKGTGSSGYVRGSKEWNAYCRKYWPASWDAKTGTVIKSGHKRVPCPA
jgi:hypothetical protein